MIQNLQDTVTLNNGVKMPGLGLGVFRVEEGQQVQDAVRWALEAGYRHIDTAAAYGNEVGVGQAVADTGIARDEIFITSKIWNKDQGYETTLEAYDAILDRLKMDYVDLVLIHWPVKGKYVDTWRALEKLYKEKKVRAIGVSNFHIHHLEDIFAVSDIVPAVDQVECHPLLAQSELKKFVKNKGIWLEAWSPIMKGNLDIPVLKELAAKYHKTPAQVVIRWHIQRDVIVIPKSIHKERIVENAQVFDFTLSADELDAIDALNENKRFGSDPDNFNF